MGLTDIRKCVDLIGKIALLSTEGLKVPVLIRDVKTGYGRMRYMISPVDGSGEKWVDEDRITSRIDVSI